MPFQKGQARPAGAGRKRTKPPAEIALAKRQAAAKLIEERGDWIARMFDELDFNPLRLMAERAKALYYGGAEPDVLLPWLKELAGYQASKKQTEAAVGTTFQVILQGGPGLVYPAVQNQGLPAAEGITVNLERA